MELIGIARTSLAQAQQVQAILQEVSDVRAQRVCDRLTEFMPQVERAIDQAVRRVLNGESVPASDKVVSLFEPHTQILQRGKAPPHETEFGHKVNYAEVEHGLVSDWQVIATGNPPDETLLPPLLRRHRQRFGHVPHLLAGDRGFFSPENERLARRMGVKQISIPHHGHRTARRRIHEKKRWFKDGQRFRNGIEGRISVLKRTVQLTRCPSHGLDGFERWVGWGILVANLVVIARALHGRRRSKSHQETGKMSFPTRTSYSGPSTGTCNGNPSHDFAIARLNSNGTLDNTFGSGGRVTADFGGDDSANAVVIQPDGKIVVAGEAVFCDGTSAAAVVRFNSSGTLDTAFGTAG